MGRIRQSLTYANVISTLCLFLILGGGTAVALRGSNTVFSDDIVNGEVETQDISDTDGVSSADVRDDTLEGAVLKRQIWAPIPSARARSWRTPWEPTRSPTAHWEPRSCRARSPPLGSPTPLTNRRATALARAFPSTRRPPSRWGL